MVRYNWILIPTYDDDDGDGDQGEQMSYTKPPYVNTLQNTQL